MYVLGCPATIPVPLRCIPTASASITKHSTGWPRLSMLLLKRERTANIADDWDYEINWAIPHQTGTKAMRTGQAKLTRHFNIEREYADRVLISKYIEKLGNTASTSHFVVLNNALKDGMIKKGDKIIFLIQASGLVLGVISVKIGDIKVGSQ